MPTPMNRAAFARVQSVHRSQVTRWVAAGMPVMPDGNIDAETASAWVHLNVDPVARIRAAREHAHREAAQQRAAAQHPEAGPPCTAQLTDPSDRALVAALPMLAYRIPASAAIMAVHAGASLKVAHALFRALSVAVMDDVQEQIDALDVPPPGEAADWSDAPLWDPDGFMQVNWPAVAKEACETVDPVAWEAHWRTLPAYAPEGDTEAPGAPQTDHPLADRPRRSRRKAGTAP
jgi:hypothetical protein